MCGCVQSRLTVGMVGYPNVGKSSTINRILGAKKVSVSATPGKTRHFQTLPIDAELSLCDCPGLVMPSFAFSREEMLLNGILPVAQMRSFTEPIGLLCRRFPAAVLESAYGISLPLREEESGPWAQSGELVTSLAFLRGYMSSKGVPDGSRAARLLVSDVVNGKIRWVAPPPGHPDPDGTEACERKKTSFCKNSASDGGKSGRTAATLGSIRKLEKLEIVNGPIVSFASSSPHSIAGFNVYDATRKTEAGSSVQLAQMSKRHLISLNSAAQQVDQDFFRPPPSAAITRDPRQRGLGDKKHGNRKRKEKTRRITGQYDA